MKGTGIIQNDCKDLIDPLGIYKNCVFQSIDFNKKNFIFKFLVKTKLVRRVPYFLFNGEWVGHETDFDNWIIFYNDYSVAIANQIRCKNKKAKVFAYNWDVGKGINISDSLFFDDFGTFDFAESQRCNIRFYNQFYVPIFYSKENQERLCYDFIFLGRVKSRKMQVEKIIDAINKVSTKNFIKCIGNTDVPIPYMRYIEMVKTSKCIVEVNIDGQTGLSLRSMEALFYDKKLITNNNLIKSYDFYRPENIFLIGEDKNLEEFMRVPHKKIPNNIKERYTLESWIERIIEERSAGV